MLTAEHIGIGHTRHRQVRVRLTPPVACACGLHQACIHRVLHIAFKDTILNQRGALRLITLVVDIERAAPSCERTIVHHRHAFACNALTDFARKRAGTLAVKVTFQTVPNRFMQ